MSETRERAQVDRDDPVEAGALEQRLRDSERKLRLITENATDVIMAFDMDRRLVYVNRALEEMTGYTVAELHAAHGYIDWTHPDDAPRIASHWKRLFDEKGYAGRDEFRLVTKDGRTKWCFASFGPILDEDGRQVGVQVIDRDITERKLLEERFLQAQKMEALGRLAGGVAHDFNNLLTVILAYSSHSVASAASESDLRERLARVHEAAQRGAAFTRQLLAFSRKEVVRMLPLDLGAVVTDFGRMLPRLLGDDITVSLVLEPATSPARADRGQVDQVLMNLAANARDAMPRGGKLTIEVADAAVSGDDRGALRPGRWVRLTVRDTGVGMDAETLRRLFEPFFTTKTHHRGTGLGLATVHAIVERSGGFVHVESVPGQGAAFSVYLPRSETGEAAAAALERVPEVVLARRSATLLVVDDEPSIRRLCAEFLGQQGYHVIQAASGEEALRVAQCHEGAIDLLLVDIVLPGMNGREVAERIQSQRSRVKVLYISGYMDDTPARAGVQSNEAAFLEKPFYFDQLAAKIDELLAKSV
jgi:PAS domain S-box-containing protein